jgi:peptidoglycan/LPS O-acetylase OafA/YrhL
MTFTTNHAVGYRPDIDGLRAIAVLGVLFYHVDSSMLGGGFVGVDVFFVISGFLITSLMVRDLESGSFSIARFYERRIRRILPALFCMIAACCAAAWFILLPYDLENFAKSAKYAAISLPNLYFLGEIQDYFSPQVSRLPLLHTWSLGVEEQFYIVFPLLLTILFGRVSRPKIRFAFITSVFVVSLAAAVVAVRDRPEEAFFLLPYRAWELMVGSLIAMANLRIRKTGLNHACGLAGLAMILASMVFYTEKIDFPGSAAIPPCLGAGLLIITGGDGRSISARLLSWKPLVFIGLISYSVYLWHWPLLAFARYREMPDDASSAAVLLVGSLVAGALSWQFIEKPFRKPGFGTRSMVFAAWALSCLLLISYSHLARRSEGFTNRYSSEVLLVLAYKEWATEFRNDAAKNFRPEKAPVYGASGVSPDIAVWGDSHARSLLPVLEAMALKRGRAIKHFGMNGVPPVVGATPAVKNPDRVSRYTARTLELLTHDSSIKTVILTSRWSFPNPKYEEGPSRFKTSFHERSFDEWSEMEFYYASRIRETVEQLLAAGKQVVIIEPIPAPPFNVPDTCAAALHVGNEPVARVKAENYASKHRLVLDAFDDIEPSPHLLRIKPWNKLVSEGQLLVWNDRKPLYADESHVSRAGAFYLEDLLAEAFDR